MTGRQVVREEAMRFGRFVTDVEATEILWEHTGYPGFWQGDPETCCRAQVEELFRMLLDGEDPCAWLSAASEASE